MGLLQCQSSWMLNVVLELNHFTVGKNKKAELLLKKQIQFITSPCSLQFLELCFIVYFGAIFLNVLFLLLKFILILKLMILLYKM